MERIQCALIIKDNKVLCLKGDSSLMIPFKKVNSFNRSLDGKSFIKLLKRKYSLNISLVTKLFSLKDDNKIYDLFIYQYVDGYLSNDAYFLSLNELKEINFNHELSFIYSFLINLLTKNHYVIAKQKNEYASSYNKSFLVDMFDDVDIIFDEDISYLDFLLKKDNYIKDDLSIKYFKNGLLDTSCTCIAY